MTTAAPKMMLAALTVTVNSIYQGKEGYNYSVPKNILETWYKGAGFPGASAYTLNEQIDIDQDLHSILSHILSQYPTAGKEAIYTAGAPGAGKSTLLDKKLAVLNEENVHYAFNDPDEQCLKNMQHTYWKTIHTAKEALRAESKLSEETQREVMQKAYTKWRAASNYISHMIQGYLISHGLNFAFGTTATNDKTHFGLRHLHDMGYQIRFIHLTTEDAVRIQSVLQHSLFHTTEEDVREKALMLPPRLGDTYLKHADVVEFHYRGTHGDAIHAATYDKKSRALKILDLSAYQAISSWHNAHRSQDTETWENTLSQFIETTPAI